MTLQDALHYHRKLLYGGGVSPQEALHHVAEKFHHIYATIEGEPPRQPKPDDTEWMQGYLTGQSELKDVMRRRAHTVGLREKP